MINAVLALQLFIIYSKTALLGTTSDNIQVAYDLNIYLLQYETSVFCVIINFVDSKVSGQ